MKKLSGFTLLEILITLSITTLLFAIAIPTYSNHILRTNRYAAEIALSKLATALEQYYLINNTYKNASITALNIQEPKNYQLKILSATDATFLLAAEPLANQAKNDTTCATLTLNSQNEKSITGSSTVEECW
jgi:type IV pilus assembly protein PilE